MEWYQQKMEKMCGWNGTIPGNLFLPAGYHQTTRVTPESPVRSQKKEHGDHPRDTTVNGHFTEGIPGTSA
jgi:hypothetical protein